MEIGAFTDSTPEATCNAEGQGAPFDIAQLSTAPDATFVAPVSGVITSWKTFAADGAGQTMNLKLAGLFESQYLIRRHDGPRALAPGQLNTFRTLLPVERGDMITLSPGAAPTACFLFSDRQADSVTFGGNVDTPDGQRWQPARDIEGAVLNVAVTILPPPRITAISTTQGSVAGGTPVVVAGANFAEVRSVTFSGVPALSYSVASEGQLTAVAPPNTQLTSRTIEVTTVAGKDSAPQTFNYIGCAVPNLKKATLKEAKSELASAGCALGKVKRLKKASLKKGKVTRQSPAPYSILPPGTKVSVSLKGGAKKHRKHR
ncbi:MAG TPA: PASTA domain-containing protein [Solirubrobacterales bacterium]|nr:PASTA domain-containing protein [Solirubrobacterales bacterium]